MSNYRNKSKITAGRDPHLSSPLNRVLPENLIHDALPKNCPVFSLYWNVLCRVYKNQPVNTLTHRSKTFAYSNSILEQTAFQNIFSTQKNFVSMPFFYKYTSDSCFTRGMRSCQSPRISKTCKTQNSFDFSTGIQWDTLLCSPRSQNGGQSL